MKRQDAFKMVNDLIKNNKEHQALIKDSFKLGQVVGRNDLIQELNDMKDKPQGTGEK